jgi:hypothetical protein
MAYEIHITRRASDAQILPIGLSEWRTAAQQAPGIRMAEGNTEITNPKTGEIITLRNAGGDTEVLFSADATWRRVFYWSPSGRVSFRAPRDFDLPTSAIRRLAAKLARVLGGSLVGDGGKIYD